MSVPAPDGLSDGGSKLWADITKLHPDLDPMQLIQLTEACRLKDRLDKLDELLRGDVDTWCRLTHRLNTEDYELKIDDALGKANSTANLLKQLFAAMRLPDGVTGKTPQKRSARGAHAPKGSTGKVSSLEAARAAKSG